MQCHEVWLIAVAKAQPIAEAVLVLWPPSTAVPPGTALLLLPLPWIPSARDLYRAPCHGVQISSLALLRLAACGSREHCLSASCADIILGFSDFKTHCRSVSGIYKERFESIISFSLCPCTETYVSVKPKNSRNQFLAAAAGSPEEMGESESGVLCAPEGIPDSRDRAAPGDSEPDFPSVLLQCHSSTSFSLVSVAVIKP